MNYAIEELNNEKISEYIKINSLAWLQSYKGIVDDLFLHKINSKEEIDKGIENLQKLIDDNSKRFLLKVDNKYVGLFRIRNSKYENYPNYKELGALYLLDEVKNKGYGKILFEKAAEEIKKQGYNKMIIGCLKDNPKNDFYIHMGAKFIGTNPLVINNQTLEENLYIYDIL